MGAGRGIGVGGGCSETGNGVGVAGVAGRLCLAGDADGGVPVGGVAGGDWEIAGWATGGVDVGGAICVGESDGTSVLGGDMLGHCCAGSVPVIQ